MHVCVKWQTDPFFSIRRNANGFLESVLAISTMSTVSNAEKSSSDNSKEAEGVATIPVAREEYWCLIRWYQAMAQYP
jgi:hypothetical protein